MTMSCINISDIAIITVKGVDYGCIIHDTSNLKQLMLEIPGLECRGFV